jgi:hypothetical protein
MTFDLSQRPLARWIRTGRVSIGVCICATGTSIGALAIFESLLR